MCVCVCVCLACVRTTPTDPPSTARLRTTGTSTSTGTMVWVAWTWSHLTITALPGRDTRDSLRRSLPENGRLKDGQNPKKFESIENPCASDPPLLSTRARAHVPSPQRAPSGKRAPWPVVAIASAAKHRQHFRALGTDADHGRFVVVTPTTTRPGPHRHPRQLLAARIGALLGRLGSPHHAASHRTSGGITEHAPGHQPAMPSGRSDG